MLIIADRLHKLSFRELMEIYVEGNLEKARDEYYDAPEHLGLQYAEQDFYQYLKECFFQTPGAKYAVWEEGGRYICALRWEPYEDGVLVSALETRPAFRRMGYATRLMNEVLPRLEGNVYSHVNKQNTASLSVHKKCGFSVISDSARYLDGSFNTRAYTLCRSNTK